MLIRLFAMSFIIFLSGCAQQMTHQDYNSIKKIAVINTIKDELYFYNRGLTIFENSAKKADISAWKLSSYLTDKTLNLAKAMNSPIQFTNAEIDTGKFKKDEIIPLDILEKLKSEGFDTILLTRRNNIAATMHA